MIVETGNFKPTMPSDLLGTGFNALEENKIPLVGLYLFDHINVLYICFILI